LAIVDCVPKVLNLKNILSNYILHRKIVITRRTQYELKKAEERAHILEGLKIALDNIDEVIKIIRSSNTVEDANNRLMKRFELSELQTKAILEMRLQKLTSLEVKKVVEELKELIKLIQELKAILKSEIKILNIVKKELLEIKVKFGNPRKTEIMIGEASSTDFDVEDLIAEEDMVISITNDGFIRRMPVDTFKKQRRGGKGVIGMATARKEDFVKMMTIASTHDFIFLFSNKGKVFAVKTYQMPIASKTSRGKSLKGLINLASGENITAICSIKNFEGENYLCMITKHGILKKTDTVEFSNAKKGGIIAINLKKEDELVDVRVVEKGDDIVIASKYGQMLRTNLMKMRSMGRTAAGIIGMRLAEEDFIIGMDVVLKGSSLFVITEKGFGKLVSYTNFINKGRGGKGMTYVKITDKNGLSQGIKSVFDTDEIIISSKSGMTIRLKTKDISTQGRATVGIKLLEVDDGDTVSDFAVINEEEENVE
jgi:DNA gyrase subunit A